MRHATLRITAEMLKEKLGLEDDIQINGLQYDPFRRIADVLLVSDRFEDMPEGSVPRQVADEAVKRPTLIGTRLLLSEGAELVDLPDGFQVTLLGSENGITVIKVSGRFPQNILVQKRKELLDWTENMMNGMN
jgi:hypothetical protein